MAENQTKTVFEGNDIPCSTAFTLIYLEYYNCIKSISYNLIIASISEIATRSLGE